jgi:hypothetical protein
MISQRLIEQIHESANRLTNDLIERLHTDPRSTAYRTIPRDRLIALKDDLYLHLGRWLSRRSKSAIKSRYVRLGRERYLEGIPLNELIFALSLTKSMVVDFIRHAPGRAEELNLEYDLVISIGEFFDEAIYFASVGYEDANQAQLTAVPVLVEATNGSTEKKAPIRTHHPVDESWAISRGGDIGEASG